MKRIEIQECKMELIYLMNEPKHSYQGIEILYMIDGEAEIRTDASFSLKENEIVVFNSGEEHVIRGNGSAISFRLLIPYRLLGKLSTDEIIFFQCNSVLYTAGNYSELVRLMEQLVLDYLNLDAADLSEVSSVLFQIIRELFKTFKVDQSKMGQVSPKHQLSKTDRILNYIGLHYSEPLNLPELAEHFHMSEAYFSHYFKEKVGENFLTYLNDVRIRNAALDLCQTEDSVTEIALNNGFSTPSVLNRHFRKKFGKTPLEYRNEMLESAKSMEITEEKIEEIQQQISEKIELETSRKAKPELIRVSASRSETVWENINCIMNIGETPAVCDAEIQKHILLLKDELKISYVRIWNLFSDKFAITADLDGDNFNFFYLDSVLDFFVQNDIALFLDLGQRKRVIKATSKSEVYLEEEAHQPRTIAQWENLLRHFIKHLLRRYGKAVLEKWIFEFPWNLEPYYKEDYDYVTAYGKGRSIVRELVGNAAVAGLSPNITVDEAELKDAVRKMKREGIFPDVVTMRVFLDLEHALMKDVTYRRENDFPYARQFVERIIRTGKDENLSYRFCISECSNSVANRAMIQDSCARGTMVIDFVAGMSKLVDMMGFWHGTDAVDVFYDTKKLLFGGGGVLSKDGIKKPSFYAFRFLEQLGGEVLKTGRNYIITRDSSGRIVCLFFNKREYSYSYYLKEETEHRDLSQLFRSEEKVILEIELTNMERNGEYLIKEEVVNGSSGSVQDEWKTLGNQEELRKSEIQYLKNICIPRIHMKQFVCTEGRLRFHIELEPHEMRLIHIFPY